LDVTAPPPASPKKTLQAPSSQASSEDMFAGFESDGLSDIDSAGPSKSAVPSDTKDPGDQSGPKIPNGSDNHSGPNDLIRSDKLNVNSEPNETTVSSSQDRLNVSIRPNGSNSSSEPDKPGGSSQPSKKSHSGRSPKPAPSKLGLKPINQLTNQPTGSKEPSEPNKPCNSSRSNQNSEPGPSKSPMPTKLGLNGGFDDDDLDDFVPFSQSGKSPAAATPKRRPHGSQATPAGKKRKTNNTKGRSECPVCQQSVPTHSINSHLDYCFQRDPVEVTPDIIEDDDFVQAIKSPVKTRSRRKQMK